MARQQTTCLAPAASFFQIPGPQNKPAAATPPKKSSSTNTCLDTRPLAGRWYNEWLCWILSPMSPSDCPTAFPPFLKPQFHFVLGDQFFFLTALPLPSTYNCVEVMLFFKQAGKMSRTVVPPLQCPATEDFLYWMPPTHSSTQRHPASTVSHHFLTQLLPRPLWLLMADPPIYALFRSFSPRITWFSGPSPPLLSVGSVRFCNILPV